MKYLIMKCEELNDQYECDANRVPMFITDNWKEYKLDYRFEVYEIKENNTLECIKNYDDYLESGMAWGYYLDDDDNFHLLEKFKNRTRDNKIPSKILKQLQKTDCEDKPSWLKAVGYISGSLDDKYYVYGEYFDDEMPIGC